MNTIEGALTQFVELIGSNPLIALLSALVVILVLHSLFLHLRMRRFISGANGVSLEGTVMDIKKRVGALEKNARETHGALLDLNTRVERSVQGVSVERFDPFQGAGGQQSFAVAFLNEHGDGTVVSGLHVRDGVRVYAKEVKKFTSERELSEEEIRAIKKARATLNAE